MPEGPRSPTLAERTRRVLALPPLAVDAETRIARLLHAILRSVIGIVLLSTVLVTPSLVPDPGASLVLNALLVGTLGGLLLLARRGRSRSASVILVLALWAHVTASIWLFGGVRTPALQGFFLVVLAAAMLLGFRAAMGATILSLVSALTVLLAERAGMLPTTEPPEPFRVFVIFVANLLILMGLTWLAVGDLRRINRLLREEVQERRSAEDRLRKSEARVRSIVESSPMAILLYALEPSGRLVLTGSNPASDRVLGIPVGPLVGLTIEEAFPSLAGTEVPDRYRRICAEGRPWNTEVEYRDDRFRGVYEVHAFQTAPGMMAAMFLDITERRQAEEERRRLEEQLRQSQKMEAVGRLAGGIAHDFNNLLMVIMGHGELLRRGFQSDDPRLRKVQHVMGAAERAARLVRQLLAFSRKQVLEPQLVDLNALVSDTARMLRPLLGEDVKVVTRLAADLGRVRVDPAQIDQVLMNLAVNARDAMPRGGTLSLETANTDSSSVAGDVAPRHVVLTVRDTGHGMDERTCAQVFEPFFTTKAGSGGTGLGLAMVYGIVQQSGGQITVESAPGRGSSFRILLPRADGPGEPAEAVATAAPAGAAGETVLVVEDEPAIRALACEMLEGHGYRTLSAGSGEEALGIAVRHAGPIHLLLTDVVMSGLAGPAFAERFVVVRPQARILFMTGYAGEDLARRGLPDDPTRFLPKPFTADLLGRRVREVLDG